MQGIVPGINWQTQNQVASRTSRTQPCVTSKSKDAAWPTWEVSTAQVPASACLCSSSEPLKIPGSFSHSLVSQTQAAPTPMKLNEHRGEDLISKSVRWCETREPDWKCVKGEMKWTAAWMRPWEHGAVGKPWPPMLECQYSWEIFKFHFLYCFHQNQAQIKVSKQAFMCLKGIAVRCV